MFYACPNPGLKLSHTTIENVDIETIFLSQGLKVFMLMETFMLQKCLSVIISECKINIQ